MDTEKLIATLKARRIEMGLTQIELARYSSVSFAAISYLESRKRKIPTYDTVWRLATSLGLDVTLTLKPENEQWA